MLIYWLVVEPAMFIGRLFRGVTFKNPEREAAKRNKEIYANVNAIATDLPDRTAFGTAIAQRIIDDPDSDRYDMMIEVALDFYDLENFGDALCQPPAVANSIEAARWRDWVSKQSAKRNPHAVKLAQDMLVDCFHTLMHQIPKSTGDDIRVKLVDLMRDDVNVTIENMYRIFLNTEATELGIFEKVRKQLDFNFKEAGVRPLDYQGDDVVEAYLHHTPLRFLFYVDVGYQIPEEARYEGQWICAPQGTGKTQFIQFQIRKLIPKVINGECSIIVMDSQEEMIRILSHVSDIQDRLVLIDANDVEYPLALNIFDLGQSGNLSPVEQERQLNTALEVVGFMLDSLLGSELTSKQQVVFRFLTQAMLAIPDATILTFQDLLQHGTAKYQQYIDTLEGAAKSFFEDQFNNKQFAPTREEINRRLYGILGIRAWERMFTQHHTKLDLFAEMNAGKVICINTARSLLQPKGCEAFGRFFLALITMAAQRRATLERKLPCHVFIDEVYDYLPNTSDSNILTIIEQCRKQKIALTVAHQNTSQLSQRTLDTFQTVAIKCASSLTNRDAHILAPSMHCAPEMLTNQPRGTFMIYVRNVTPSAIPIKIPFGMLEKMARMTDDEYEELKTKMRERYAGKKQEPEPTSPENTPTPEGIDVEEVNYDCGYPHQEDYADHADHADIVPPEVTTAKPKRRKRKKATTTSLDSVDTTPSKSW